MVSKGEPTINEAIKYAIGAIKKGDIEKGRSALTWVLKRDPKNITALLWLSKCTENQDAKVKIYERVLDIDPENSYALKGLQRYGAVVQSSVPPEVNDSGGVPSREVVYTGEHQGGFSARFETSNYTFSIWQIVGFLGSVAVLMGVFLPIVDFLIIGSFNLIEVRYIGISVLILSIATIALIVMRRHDELWITGMASLGLVTSVLMWVTRLLSELQDVSSELMEEEPLSGLFAALAVETVKLQWGWGVLIVGCLLILAAAMIKHHGKQSWRALGAGAFVFVMIMTISQLTDLVRYDFGNLGGVEESEEVGVSDNNLFTTEEDTESTIKPTYTAKVQLSCEEGAQQYFSDIQDDIMDFGNLAMEAVSTSRFALGTTILEMEWILEDMEKLEAPECVEASRALLLSGHRNVISGFDDLYKGAGGASVLRKTEQGLLEIENALDQLTAIAQGRPTPIPKKLPTRTPLPTPIPTATPLAAGSSILIDDWQVRVDRIVFVKSISSSVSSGTEKAAGRFALLFLAVTNRGLSTDSFMAFSKLEIIDAEGRRSEENIMASTYAQYQYNADYGIDIRPDETVHIVAAYDISEHSQYYVLVPGILVDEYSNSVYLDIP